MSVQQQQHLIRATD